MLVLLSACLSCLSVKLPWMIQGKYRATLEFKSSRCAVSSNLNYDSSLSLSVSIKVIPKSFDSAIASAIAIAKCYCFKPVC